jgi:hypothetical protein
MTSQGHPYTVFGRALEHGKLLVAEATAKELPPLSLTDALELTMLIAERIRAGILASPRAGCCATSRSVTTRRLTRLRWSRAASLRSLETATGTRPRHFGPWPKEPVAVSPHFSATGSLAIRGNEEQGRGDR